MRPMQQSEPTVTAVLVAYWPHRMNYVYTILEALKNQTRKPDKIIVFNNNKEFTIDPIEGVEVVNSTGNFTSRVKYPAALLYPSNYYLLLDDDVCPGPKVLEKLMEYAYPGCCWSNWGRQMTENFYNHGQEVKATEITDAVHVDSFIGILQFVSFEAIVNMLQLESKCRIDDNYFLFDGEDIIIAMANRGEASVFPYTEEIELSTDPDAQITNMQSDWGYHQIRDLFAFKAWLALGNKPFPGYTPDDDAHRKAARSYKRSLKKRDSE